MLRMSLRTTADAILETFSDVNKQRLIVGAVAGEELLICGRIKRR